MKHLCSISALIIFIFLNTLRINSQSIAFYYGNDFSNPKSKIYDIVIVQPENIPENLVKANPERYYAYVSILEFNDEKLKKFAKGYNKSWESYIGDIRDEKYIKILMGKIENLREKGFKNFFFDTLDSYKILTKNRDEQITFEKGIVEFIKKFKKKYPESDIIMNRPLDILKEVRGLCDKIAVESLYYGIDPSKKEYIKMKDEDTKWLKSKINQAKKMGYKVYVIDYLPEEEENKRTEVARKIFEDGFIPYISDINLENWGNNEYEKIKRDVLMVYDSDIYPDPIFSSAHRILSLPLEYYGYRPKLTDIKNLPENIKSLKAAVFVETNFYNQNSEKNYRWIKKAIDNGIKILFIGGFPVEEQYLNKLGIYFEKNNFPVRALNIHVKDRCAGYEAEPKSVMIEKVIKSENSKTLLSYKNSNQIHEAIALTPWGGYVDENSFTRQLGEDELLVFNPLCLFKKALELENIPVPDITTVNGNRMLFVHIDGDGFKSFYEDSFRKKYASEVLFEEILSKYKIPHSVSIIRGEIEHPEIPFEETEKLKKIARKIFLLPNVEVANHSYSHPHSLVEIKKSDGYNLIQQLYDIKIEGYKPDIYTEIIATKKWIESEIIPEKKNNIYFWTGNCIAPYSALKLLYENSMLNINGGDTTITTNHPFLSKIAPAGIERNGLYQIYTVQQNENIYTNFWTIPKSGYEKVIETFELTDIPLRLKPINIYYHFYSASTYESLKALKKVYNHALSKDVIPVFTSDYVKSVLDFYNAEIFNYKNSWIIVSDGNIKTLRVKDKYPIINEYVCGYRKINEETYLHLCGNPPYKIVLTDTPPKEVYIKSSNAYVDEFSLKNNSFFIKFRGYVPVKYSLGNNNDYNIKEKEYRKDIYFIKEVYGKKRRKDN